MAPGFMYPTNGNNNASGMKQSMFGGRPPTPKAKNPQVGPVDPSVLLHRMNLKQEPVMQLKNLIASFKRFRNWFAKVTEFVQV